MRSIAVLHIFLGRSVSSQRGFAIWPLVIGPVAQNDPKIRATPATKTVANAAMSVCANVHTRSAPKAMIRGGSTTARRDWPNP